MYCFVAFIIAPVGLFYYFLQEFGEDTCIYSCGHSPATMSSHRMNYTILSPDRILYRSWLHDISGPARPLMLSTEPFVSQAVELANLLIVGDFAVTDSVGERGNAAPAAFPSDTSPK